jgi:mono/diheme cytochrome c family protein
VRGRMGRDLSGLAWGLALALVLAVPALPALAQAPSSPSSAALPEGPGAETVKARCLGCHGVDLIDSQRLSDAGWGREIDKMVRWGATVSEAERAGLQAYLAAHFAPRPAVSHSRAAEGEGVFARACLACHGADLSEQQRLSPAGWTREVEKMMRWGAVVSETDKPALVDFLASRYPVR